MTKLTINSTIPVRGGSTAMPLLGFGVYQSTAAEASSATALTSGYRHIDSARVYRNESEVVKAVQDFKKAGGGGSVWLTTKATGRDHGIEKMDKAVEESISKAEAGGLGWQLYLLHDPTAGAVKRLEAWKVLEQKQKEGKLEAIGVSNFSEVHLKEFKDAGVSTPAVNQIELHPFLQQKPIIAYCQANDIVVQAYCPIVRGQRMDDPTIQELSKKHGKTGAQILIRWSLQKGYVPLPKSDTPSRIKENADVFDFELSADDMAKLDSLDEGPKGACSWNPVAHA